MASRFSLPLSSGAAAVLAAVFLTFTAIAVIQYPRPWSPLTTYLSDFGNMKVSPTGSSYYNLGCILTGLAVIPFYVGLKDWYSTDRWRYVLMLGQLLGVASGVALALVGYYPEDFPPEHRFWSYTFFTINFFAMLLVNSALAFSEHFSRRSVVFCYASLVVTIVYFYLYGGTPIIEWFTVAASIIYSALVALDTYWLSKMVR